MPLKISHTGDAHLDEDSYFGDTACCLEWFVADSISSGTDLLVINGDLTTYKATIRERNLWIDRLIDMASHAPVILVAGNHGRELEGDLYVYARAHGRHEIYLCTEPEFIELDRTAVAVFPYPRRAEVVGNGQRLQEAFERQIDEVSLR